MMKIKKNKNDIRTKEPKLKEVKPMIISPKNCDFQMVETLTYEVERDEETGEFKRDENGELLVSDGVMMNVPTYTFRTPGDFQEGIDYPKKVTIDSISIFDQNGNECWGYTVHMSFQRELDWLNNSIGTMSRHFQPKTWKVGKEHDQKFKIWFRDRDWKYFTPSSFNISGFFHYSSNVIRNY